MAPPGGHEVVDEATAHAESAILGLRMREGLPAEMLADPRLGTGLAWARSTGLLTIAAERVILTRRGRALADEVSLRLLPDGPRSDGEGGPQAAAASSAAAT